MGKAIKAVAIAGVLMLLVFGIAAYALVARFNRDADSIELRNAERLAEVARIRGLPELRGVWVHATTMHAPFSGDPVAACLLIKSRKIHYSGPTGGRSTGVNDLPPFHEEDAVAVVRAADMRLSIAGVVYPFTLDSLILSNAHARNGKGGGYILSSHAHPQVQVKDLPVRSALITAHLDERLGGRGPDIRLQEILFAPGDTLSFYGRIEAGGIVPMF